MAVFGERRRRREKYGLAAIVLLSLHETDTPPHAERGKCPLASRFPAGDVWSGARACTQLFRHLLAEIPSGGRDP